MKKVTSKFLAILLIFTLAGFQFITTGVYAADLLSQNANTSEENVKFNATLGNEDSKDNYVYNANLDFTENKVYFNLSVLNTGYLKDIVINLENNNYIFNTANINDSRIKNITETKLELNQINAGENIEIAIPITFEKNESISKDYFNKESKVTLNATYVNEKNKERKIEKEIDLNLSWSISEENLTTEISQNVIRYLTYNNKTMLSVIVKDKLKDSKLPIDNKEIKISVPELSGYKPSEIIVSAISTGNTNGKNDGTSFSNEDWEYDEQEGTVTIKTTNSQNEEGNIAWNKELADSFVITYLYDVNMNEEATTISTKVSSNVLLVNGQIAQNETTENEYKIDGKIGDIVNTEIINDTNSINKGYMYNNINAQDKKETDFSQTYKINVGLVEALDKINVKETGTFLNETEVSNYVYNKKISTTYDEFIKILGENGYININNEDGSLIGTINKDNLSIDVNASKISIELSKPITEGDISLKVDKAIKGELPFTKNQMQDFNKLSTKIAVNKETISEIALEEPTSKASIEISNKNLSTVVKNEDVIITATLETNDISDALYENPELSIELPEEVKNIDLKDAKLLFEDELVQNEFKVEGNKIYLSLNGLQTKYATQATSNGTVVRLVTDLTLDNLAPNKESNVILNYTNNNTATQEKEATTNTVETPVTVVAPSEFVITNSMSGYNEDQTVTSQEGKESIGNIVANSSEKTMKITGTVVNNLGFDASGVAILGRIPYKGNKNVATGEDLGSTFDTKLNSQISLEGINAPVFYSTNENADSDFQKEENAWSQEYSEDAKSYLIVIPNTLTNGTEFTFSYNVKVPANLQYKNTVKSNFAIYYNNNAEEGEKQNVVGATPVGITTGLEPEVKSEITAYDFNTGEVILNNGNITEGQYIKFKVKVKNETDKEATNVKVTQLMPEELAALVYEEGSIGDPGEYVLNYDIKEQTETIEKLAPGEEKEIEFNVGNTEIISEVEGQEPTEHSIVTTFKLDSDQTEEQNFEYVMKNTKGILNLQLIANKEGKVSVGDQISFRIFMKNVNRDEKNNTVLNLKFPQGMEYSGTEYKEYYDKEKNVLSYPVGKLTSRETVYMQFYGKVTGNLASDAKVVASGTCDEGNEVFSNSVTYYSSKVDIYAEQLTNIPDGIMLDTDQLEFYIDIENRGDVDVSLTLEDTLPKELQLKDYKLVVNGNEVANATAGFIRTNFTLKAGENARATIKAKADTIEKGKEITVENKPTLKILNGADVEVNSVKLTIQGTGIYNPDEGTDEPTEEGAYKITGNVWLDEDNNGKRSSSEQKLSNIKVMLYDANEGKIAKDIAGNDLVMTTGEDGKYTFNNVKPGKYNVVAEYDTNIYMITNYHVEGSSDTENSDFINATLDGKQVAATDNLIVKNSNFYYIDLGLSKVKKFDLSINKTVAKVTATNPKLETITQDVNKQFGAVSLYNTYIESTTVLVEYNIVITNEGEIPGYAKEIVDYLPEGMEFNSELNGSWYLANDGNVYNTSLANTIIQPGESKTITLVLTRKMTGENTGTVHNQVEISKDYNEYGMKDQDSTPGNKQDGEDDISYADLLITLGTGKEVASFIGITLGVLAIIGLAVYVIKKRILNKI